MAAVCYILSVQLSSCDLWINQTVVTVQCQQTSLFSVRHQVLLQRHSCLVWQEPCQHFTAAVVKMIFCQFAVLLNLFPRRVLCYFRKHSSFPHTATRGQHFWISFHAHTCFSVRVCVCYVHVLFFCFVFTMCASSTPVSPNHSPLQSIKRHHSTPQPALHCVQR